MIKLVVAYDENMLIGRDNDLPWNIKEDLEHFKRTTLNKNVLFGKTTYETIPNLKNRNIFVLTHDKNLEYKEEINIVNDYNEIVKRFSKNKNEDIYICGGVMIYKLFLPFVDEMIVSHIKGTFEGNKYFPEWDKELFVETKRENFNDFVVIYSRKK